MYGYKRELTAPYEEVVKKTVDELKKEGFGVLTEIDVKATLKKKLDVDFDNYVILGACNPPFAYKSLQAERDIGLLLPPDVFGQIVRELPVNLVDRFWPYIKSKKILEKLPPEKAAPLIAISPDDLLASLTARLLQEGRYPLIAAYADHVPAGKLKDMALLLEQPGDMLKVAHYMKNSQRMLETTRLMSDDYLLDMMHQVSKLEQLNTLDNHGDPGQRIGAFLAGAFKASGKDTPQFRNFCKGLERVIDFSSGLP